MEDSYDICIIGGGINGCGIARDAAGRGYSVLLAEMNDLGSGTSSWSTKLIHGGLRYLEHYEFRLVREALMERETLWQMAPHIIWPLRFVLPHHAGMRPAWLLRLGLFLYDHLGGRKLLPATRVLNLHKDEAGNPLKPAFAKAFEYSDCWVNDARLVVLNAGDARDRGADILTRTRVVSAIRDNGAWRIGLQDTSSKQTRHITARILVNAGGPWIDRILSDALQQADTHNVRLVQGSHIVIKRKYGHDRAYLFQNADERIFFAIPYEQDYTLIGTTDQDYHGNPCDVHITDSEIDYLCRGASQYFREPVTRDDIVWTYSGVRPLFDDGASKAQEATRDYVLRTNGTGTEARLINIFGGKITTYRRLAESVLELIADAVGGKGEPWTAHSTLPGGDFPQDGFPALLRDVRSRHPYLEEAQALRMTRAYGTRIWTLLDGSASLGNLGPDFGAGLTGREVDYLMAHEWAKTADDILWRRSKLGITFNKAQVRALEDWMSARQASGHKN